MFVLVERMSFQPSFIPPQRSRSVKCAQGPRGAPGQAAGLGAECQDLPQERSQNEFGGEPEAASGAVGQGLRAWNHYTHQQAAGLRLQDSSSTRLISDLSFHINPGSVRKPWTLQAQLCVGHEHQALGSAGASVPLLARNAKPAPFPHFPREKNKCITEPNAFQHKAKRAGGATVVLGCSISGILSLLQYHHYALQNNFCAFL